MNTQRHYPTRTFLSPEEMEAKAETTLTERKWLDDYKKGNIYWMPDKQTLFGTEWMLWEKGDYERGY